MTRFQLEDGPAQVKGCSLLAVNPDISSALQLESKKGNEYHPLLVKTIVEGATFMGNGRVIYNMDSELDIIGETFWNDKDDPLFRCSKNSMYSRFRQPPFHHTLNLPNTLGDVRMRTEGTRELVENEELYRLVQKTLQNIYTAQHDHYLSAFGRETLRCEINPKTTKEYLEDFARIADMGRAEPFRRLGEWVAYIEDHGALSELLTEHRKITDSRMFITFTERYTGAQVGMLKPGINPEDVFDMLPEDQSKHTVYKRGRRGKVSKEERSVVKVKDGFGDKQYIEQIVAHARQRMDILNELSAKKMALPMALTHLQLKQMYAGARLYHRFEERGLPATFAEISDEPWDFSAEGLYPVRMVLEDFCEDKNSSMATNTYTLTQDDQFILIEGANERGKSEAWRQFNFSKHFINAGWPLPGRRVVSGVTPNTHFISCKGNSGFGGSEFRHSIDSIIRGLKQVHDGDDVILDELGDSTNAPTGREWARRTLEVLGEKKCRVLMTCHHDAATQLVKDMGGKVFTPDSSAQGIGKYSIVESNGLVNFRPEETLDRMDYTTSNLRKVMPGKERLQPKPGHVEQNSSEFGEEELWEEDERQAKFAHWDFNDEEPF